jgi:hypothetical protein
VQTVFLSELIEQVHRFRIDMVSWNVLHFEAPHYRSELVHASEYRSLTIPILPIYILKTYQNFVILTPFEQKEFGRVRPKQNTNTRVVVLSSSVFGL